MSNPSDNSASEPREGDLARNVERLADRSQLDFDIEFFGRVLARSPFYLDVLRCQAPLLSRKGLHEQALQVERRLVSLRPYDGVAHYNLACRLALAQQPREAVAELGLALECGYDDFDYLEADADLESVRQQPEYQQLLRQHGVTG
ncbi:MAG: hypothetical protein AB7O62_18780 [Pirellulales bacterium]